MYTEGKGVPQDDAEAVKWHRMAAEQGHPAAQCCLAIAYSAGNSVPEDHAEAVKWYDMAAKQGYDTAQYLLGVMHQAGILGAPEDKARAYAWFHAAAAQGHEDAEKRKNDIAESMTREERARAEEELSREFVEPVSPFDSDGPRLPASSGEGNFSLGLAWHGNDPPIQGTRAC